MTQFHTFIDCASCSEPCCRAVGSLDGRGWKAVTLADDAPPEWQTSDGVLPVYYPAKGGSAECSHMCGGCIIEGHRAASCDSYPVYVTTSEQVHLSPSCPQSVNLLQNMDSVGVREAIAAHADWVRNNTTHQERLLHDRAVDGFPCSITINGV